MVSWTDAKFRLSVLRADLARSACVAGTVDSALERVDVAFSKRGTFGLRSVFLRDLRRCFLTQCLTATKHSGHILLPIDQKLEGHR